METVGIFFVLLIGCAASALVWLAECVCWLLSRAWRARRDRRRRRFALEPLQCLAAAQTFYLVLREPEGWAQPADVGSLTGFRLLPRWWAILKKNN